MSPRAELAFPRRPAEREFPHTGQQSEIISPQSRKERRANAKGSKTGRRNFFLNDPGH
jgi:hypothetical protein